MRRNSISNMVDDANKHYANMNGAMAGVGAYNYGRINPYLGMNAGGSAGGMAAGTGKLDLQSRTIFTTIANGSTDTQSLSLFNSYQDMTDANLNVNLTISVQGSTHVRLKREIATTPVFVVGLKFNTTTAAQLDNAWTVRNLDSIGGGDNSFPFVPRSRFTAGNFQSTHIDAEDFALMMDGSWSLEFTVAASETVTLSLSIKTKADFANTVLGRSVLETTNIPPATGNILADRLSMQNTGVLNS